MEELYAEVSRVAAERMDAVQLSAFRGETPREQIAAFLRAHMRAMKRRPGDAVYRSRSIDAGVSAAVAGIWEASRQRAIDKMFQTLGLDKPSPRHRVCLRAWIAFHDRLVAGWLADHTLTEREVLQWSLSQLDHLAHDVLGVDLLCPLPAEA